MKSIHLLFFIFVLFFSQAFSAEAFEPRYKVPAKLIIDNKPIIKKRINIRPYRSPDWFHWHQCSVNYLNFKYEIDVLFELLSVAKNDISCADGCSYEQTESLIFEANTSLVLLTDAINGLKNCGSYKVNACKKIKGFNHVLIASMDQQVGLILQKFPPEEFFMILAQTVMGPFFFHIAGAIDIMMEEVCE